MRFRPECDVSNQKKKILVAPPTFTPSGTADDNRQDMIKANRIVLFSYIIYSFNFFFSILVLDFFHLIHESLQPP